MLNRFLSTKTCLTLAAVVAVGAAPLSGWAKKAEPLYNSNDTTYQYVSGVFDKLQSHWEQQAYDQRLAANATLTFVLNEDGTLISSQMDAAESDNGAAKEALSFLKQSVPFGHFPTGLAGDRMEFKFKLTPGSMQMVSYHVVENLKNRDSVISYGAPASPASTATSLFYARVVDTTETPHVGKVWEKPEVQNSDEQAMDEYISGVQARIEQTWQQPSDAVNFAPTVAVLQIDRDGSLLSATVKQSSGNKAIDKAILKSIFQAGPFNRIPDSAKSLPLTIEYVFEPVVSTIFEDAPAKRNGL
jgi:TonB family protein